MPRRAAVPGGRQALPGIQAELQSQDILQHISPTETVDADAEQLLLELADDFVENVAACASQLAKHRGSDKLEAKDVELHLGMRASITHPFTVLPQKNTGPYGCLATWQPPGGHHDARPSKY